MEQPGPHDSAIGRYLDDLGIVEESDIGSYQRRRSFGFALSRELEKLDGESFVLVDGAGNPLGISVVGPAGLTIVGLEADHRVVAVHGFGQLRSPLLRKTSPIDDGDLETPHRLALEHALLPGKRLIHDAQNKDALDHAYEVFAAAFTS